MEFAAFRDAVEREQDTLGIRESTSAFSAKAFIREVLNEETDVTPLDNIAAVGEHHNHSALTTHGIASRLMQQKNATLCKNCTPGTFNAFLFKIRDGRHHSCKENTELAKVLQKKHGKTL